MKQRVAVLTTFYAFDDAYSLHSVVKSQLVSLVKYGYDTVLFVHDNFKDDDLVPEGVEIRKVIPRFELEDYTDHHPVNKNFNNEVETAFRAFEEYFQDIDIVIDHDLIFQGWFLPYCVAIHKFAEESKIKWFHWIHSVPNLRPKDVDYPHRYRYELPKNSKLVYLNNYNLIRAAESYSIFPKDVRIVYNPIDPRLFGSCHPLVKSLIDKYNILEADFLQVYPVSTPRMVDGKQVHIIIEIMGKLKKLGWKPCLVVCNAHANAEKEKEMVRECQRQAVAQGLTANEVIFTSFEGTDWEHGVPREVVSQLMKLSNLFIFPTRSENCPLILLEAMLSKCLLILNNSLPVLREFGGENALYFNFGSLDQKVNWENSRDKYMEDIAKIIIAEYQTNKALKGQNLIKQKYNLDKVFRQQIEPLFFEQ